MGACTFICVGLNCAWTDRAAAPLSSSYAAALEQALGGGPGDVRVVSTRKVKPITEEYLRQQGRFAPD